MVVEVSATRARTHAQSCRCSPHDTSVISPLSARVPFELAAHAHTAFNESNSNDTEYCQIRATGGAGDTPYNYTAVCQVMMQAHFLGKTHIDCYVSYIDRNHSAGASEYQHGLKTTLHALRFALR
jgi:hypothetical protein